MGGFSNQYARTKDVIQPLSTFAILQQSDVFLEDPAHDDDDLNYLMTASKSTVGTVDLDFSDNTLNISNSQISSSSKKRVSFGNLQVREFTVVLGDHPCCTVGLPVTLGWDVETEYSIPLEDHESSKSCRRRTRHELRMSLDDRKELLGDNISPQDVRKIQRKMHRARTGRCMTGRAKEMFFRSDDPVLVSE